MRGGTSTSRRALAWLTRISSKRHLARAPGNTMIVRCKSSTLSEAYRVHKYSAVDGKAGVLQPMKTLRMDIMHSLKRVVEILRVLMTVCAVPEVEPRGIVNACAVGSQ